MALLLSEIANLLGCELKYPARPINQLLIDSRKVSKGDVFVAIKGPNHDAHTFLEDVKAKGALAAVVSDHKDIDIPQLVVKDTKIALGQIAQKHQSQFECKRIALTGSCGKTTTKTLIAEILKLHAPTLSTEGTLNNEFGVPLTLMSLNQSHQFAVIECGANHKGEIEYLINLVQPHVALITNVAPVHLEGFKTLEGIAEAKGEIIKGLTKGGFAVLPGDDAFFPYWQTLCEDKKIIRFGLGTGNNVHAKNIQLNNLGQAQFYLVTELGEIAIQLQLLGEHGVENALAAAAVAHALHIPLQTIKMGLEAVKSVDKRMVLSTLPSGAKLIDDTYNANPTAVTSVLNWLSHQKGKKVFVFGGMSELGTGEENYHFEVGVRARELGIDNVFTVGKLTEYTTKAFGLNAKHFNNQEALIGHLKKVVDKDLTILIKGSRSAQMENVVAALLETR